MSLKRRLLAGVAILAVCATAGWLLTRRTQPELVHAGKTVEEWGVQLYLSQEQSARDTAAAALKTLGAKAVPDIIRMLRRKDPFMRRLVWSSAARLPARFRKGIVSNVKPARAGLVHIAGMRAVAAVGPEARAAIPDLTRMLQGKDLQETWAAGSALGSIGPEAVRVLIAALQHQYPAVRQAALLGLKEIGPEAVQAVPAIIERLVDRDEWVRGWAAQALIAIGRPAIPQLLETIERGSGETRRGAAYALAGIYPSRRVAGPPLVKMMQDREPASRQQAIETLLAIHASDEIVIQAMKQALEDSDADVRKASSNALLELEKKVYR